MQRSPTTGVGTWALALAMSGLVACKSTGNESSPAEEPEEPGSRTVDVRVSGAEATLEGGTLKLEYPESDDINDRIPDWVINPTLGGVTGAVGVAARNDLGTREQLDESRLNGRGPIRPWWRGPGCSALAQLYSSATRRIGDL